MTLASRLGDGWAWVACGLVVLGFGGSQRFKALAAASLAALSGILLFVITKRLTGRERPRAVYPHWAELIPPDRFSFPSGHTITAFAIAQSLSAFYPSWSPFLLLFAANIAVSRVILGMHFLTDVLAGSLLGVLIGSGCAYLFR